MKPIRLINAIPPVDWSPVDLISFFVKRNRMIFNAGKTKLVVTGSKLDMNYYADISPWSLDGQPVNVVDNNEHLGLIVSGSDEEDKNIDENIHKCRKSLFGLLGPAFAFKCLLSHSTQVFLWRMYSLPSLRSGLSSLPIRPANLGPLKTFHNKILRSFLKLSQSSPIPALHFLLGELPIEGWLNLDLLSLFYNIWNNPSTTMFDMAKYLLKM